MSVIFIALMQQEPSSSVLNKYYLWKAWTLFSPHTPLCSLFLFVHHTAKSHHEYVKDTNSLVFLHTPHTTLSLLFLP